jgi:hypothetical protein
MKNNTPSNGAKGTAFGGYSVPRGEVHHTEQKRIDQYRAKFRRCLLKGYIVTTLQYGEFIAHVPSETHEEFLADMKRIALLSSLRIVRIRKDGRKMGMAEWFPKFQEVARSCYPLASPGWWTQ